MPSWLTDDSSAAIVPEMEIPTLVPPDVLAMRVRMVMGAKKMSRKRLAEVTGISRPSLANKLDGKVSFTYDELLAVVAALDVSWEALLTESRGKLSAEAQEPRVRLSDMSLLPGQPPL
jgi:transcriptional regulator with XRE-family HTH domain